MGKKILIIEDTPEIVEALTVILKGAGYTPEVFSEAEDIFAALKRSRPDVIILDALLAGHDGPSIAKLLKGNTETSSIPIIMISAHPALERMAEESNVDGYLPKPFSIPALLGKLTEVLP